VRFVAVTTACLTAAVIVLVTLAVSGSDRRLIGIAVMLLPFIVFGIFALSSARRANQAPSGRDESAATN
jgi:hypothetical protein